MNLQTTIFDVRTKGGWTQDEFAEKLHVTRQAVSRWENGETTPTVGTLRAIAELFQVDMNELLGVCQSCAMKLTDINEMGTGKDDGVDQDYCVHCFKNGKFTANTIEEAVEGNLPFLNEFNAENDTNFTEAQARDVLRAHLKTLKRWRR